MTQSQFDQTVYSKMTWEEKVELCEMLRLLNNIKAYYFRQQMIKKYSNK